LANETGRTMTTKRVKAKDLVVGDTVHWQAASGVVQGRIHDIEEKKGGVRTIRIEPVGSHSRMLNADDTVDVVIF